MTHALTRVFSRAKRRRDPEYLPPYFWHRYYVWMPFIYLPAYLLLTWFIDGLVGDSAWYRNGPLALLATFFFAYVPCWIRRGWARRELRLLAAKLSAWQDSDKVSAYEAGEAQAKLKLFEADLRDYSAPGWNSKLSVRRTPWTGSGTRYTVYQRGKPKRVFTFYHE